ncbi:MAG: hypothetical protein VB102_05065 [Paludibacter sp.]|nr:hypothetical protein [Paludibacter sp.]
MLVKLSLIAVTLPLLGYLRSSIQSKKPGYLLNSSSMLKNWQSENNWAARFSPLFAIFIFLFNLFAWGVYGFVSIFEFLAFLIKKLWWLIMWCWNEVLHPTVFALVRYLWHYLVVCSWKFFRFAFAKIPESVKKENIMLAFRKLLLFGAVCLVALITYLLTMNMIVLVIASLVVFYFFQYTVFSTITCLRPDDFSSSPVSPGLRISVLWLALSTVSAALLVLLTQFADIYIISGLSILLIQVLLPFVILFGLAFLSTTFYLPAYIKEFGPDVEVLKFLKVWLFRLPKLCVSQLFQFTGLFILSIIPFAIVLMLNAGIKQITDKDIPGWTQHVVVMDYHIPSIKSNKLAVEDMIKEKAQLVLKRDSVENIYKKKITSSRNELDEAVNLKSKISDNAIHTFDRKAYVGENQSFSIPDIEDCTDYEWKVKDAVTNAEIRKINIDKNQIKGSPVFYHQWSKAGNYVVSLVPKNICGNATEASVNVEVINRPVTANGEKFQLPVTKYFVTREAADYAIDMINGQINDIQQDKKEALKIYDKNVQIYSDRINHLNFISKEHVQMLISKILGLMGLMLMMILYLSVIWTYLVTYHYDMFGFEQARKHYWVNLLEEIRSKNPNQPLLGIFVLLVVSSVLIFNDFCMKIINIIANILN